MHFVNEMRECVLMYETNPSVSSPRPKVSLCDCCDSYLFLEVNSIVDTPLITLEEAFDPLLTSISFNTHSSPITPRDTK